MKSVILKLDKERELRYGFKALKLLREKFGNKSLSEMMELKVDEIPQLIWAGLKMEDKALTVDKVEDLLDEAITMKKTYTIMDVTSMGLEALALQMGVDLKKVEADALKKLEKKQEKKQPKRQPKKTTVSTKQPKRSR